MAEGKDRRKIQVERQLDTRCRGRSLRNLEDANLAGGGRGRQNKPSAKISTESRTKLNWIQPGVSETYRTAVSQPLEVRLFLRGLNCRLWI